MDELPPDWSLLRRVTFRFGVVFAIAQIVPFPLDVLPKLEWLTSRYGDAWEWVLRGFADVIGAVIPPPQPTGSGDTTAAFVGLLMQVVLGALGAAVWSAIDERRGRRAYPRLARGAHIVLRYWLAFAMLGYGIVKLCGVQFVPPRLATLDHQVGQMSPMGLLWTFMGFSRPYTLFAGVGECLGGALLLWRRTATLGAVVLVAILTNVVMLNFCYDVPVKLYSSMLLLAAIVVAAPDLRRILAALLGRAVPARSVAWPLSRRGLWIRAIVKLVLVTLVIAVQVHDDLEAGDQRAVRSPLHGVYDVESYTIDGVELRDAQRWRRVIFEGGGATIRAESDESTWYRAEIDDAARTVALTLRGGSRETYAVSRPAADRLVLDVAHVHVVLRLRTGEFPLMTRGFHWIQELPVNR